MPICQSIYPQRSPPLRISPHPIPSSTSSPNHPLPSLPATRNKQKSTYLMRQSQAQLNLYTHPQSAPKTSQKPMLISIFPPHLALPPNPNTKEKKNKKPRNKNSRPSPQQPQHTLCARQEFSKPSDEPAERREQNA